MSLPKYNQAIADELAKMTKDTQDFVKYISLYAARRPSSVAVRKRRTEAALVRKPEPKRPMFKVPLAFRFSHTTRNSNRIGYAAILDYARMRGGSDKEYVRHYDAIYTMRTPWKQITIPFMNHVLNEYGYEIAL